MILKLSESFGMFREVSKTLILLKTTFGSKSAVNAATCTGALSAAYRLGGKGRVVRQGRSAL